jgi:glycine oxidase
MYADFVLNLKEETGIDVEFDETGTLYLAFDEDDRREILHRYEWQKEAGLAVELLDRTAIVSTESSVNEKVLEGLFFPEDKQVENRKLLQALTSSVRNMGGDIVEGCEVSSVSRSEGELMVESRNSKRIAGKVILCGGAWSSLVLIEGATIPTIEPVKGQMLEFKDESISPRHVIYSPRGYVVPRRDGRLIAGSTMESVKYDKTPTASGASEVIGKATEILPALTSLVPSDHYTGLRPKGSDAAPFIDRVDEHNQIFAATGHFRNGILLAPLTAEIMTDILTA